jgi:hypothetical protein
MYYVAFFVCFSVKAQNKQLDAVICCNTLQAEERPFLTDLSLRTLRQMGTVCIDSIVVPNATICLDGLRVHLHQWTRVY